MPIDDRKRNEAADAINAKITEMTASVNTHEKLKTLAEAWEAVNKLPSMPGR